MMVLWVLATLGLPACNGNKVVIEDKVEVPENRFVDLPAETRTDVDAALRTINSSENDRIERADAYLFIAEVNLAMWDQLRLLSEDEELSAENYREMVAVGQAYYMQAYRAKARSWATRNDEPSTDGLPPYEVRFADAWDKFDQPQKAFDELSVLLKEVIQTKRSGDYIAVDFLSDLRYSCAVFFTVLERPGGDMKTYMDITQDEAEAVRFAGDVAFLYGNLSTKPENAAETYRAIAQSKPKTREGYEAQVSVLEAMKQQRRIGVMESGDEDAFDTSSQGVELFRTVGEDLDVLVQLNTYKDQWKASDSSDNLEVRSEELVRSFTLRMHGLAQKSENPAFYEMASNAYKQYHALFPGSGYRYEMLYFYAEALYEMQRFDDAYEQYKQAMGQNPRGKFQAEVYRSLVLSAYKRAEKEPLPDAPSDVRIPMPDPHRDFISSGEQFIAQMGEEDPDMAGFVRYEIIIRHYLYGEWTAAETLMEEFVKYNYDHPSAPKAAVLWLDLLARVALRGDDRDMLILERTADKMYANPSLLQHEIVKNKLTEVTQKPPKVSNTLP